MFNNQSIVKTAKKLGIKISTACAIINNYKKKSEKKG